MERALILVLALALSPSSVAAPTLEELMRFPAFREVQISPGGQYLAATVPDGEQTGVVILDLRDPANVHVSAGIRINQFENAVGLTWANDDRLVFTSQRQEGTLAAPSPTGRIYALNADGSRGGQIYGQREGLSIGRFAAIIHRLPDDPEHVLILDYAAGRNERPLARKLHIYSQDRAINVAASPLERGTMAADQDGIVRVAVGADADLNQVIAWRPDETAEWRSFANPLGGDLRDFFFNQAGTHVYVRSLNSDDLGVFRIELATGEFEKLLGDETFEPTALVSNRDRTDIIGAAFATPIQELRFFNPDHPDTRRIRALLAAFPSYEVVPTSATRDGSIGILAIRSDREPGVFLAVEFDEMRVTELVAARPWIDPEELAAKRPISFTARDGLELHGYLTVPPGREARDLPMVVEVHGGPHGPRDAWPFDPWIQAMALNGYAVLQINFRGSGGRGMQFERGAYRQWGRAMQDDITDGTLWAIEQGIAHPDRVCLSGASYGGYSVLSGLTREPDLYRCGFAFVGVYDLELIKRTGNIPRTQTGRTYLDQAVGTDTADLRARSPIHFVDRIKADLFVAHGALDRQADSANFRALTRALEDAGIEHEQLLTPGEGHGYYLLENRVELYSRALALFDRTIGSGWTSRE